MKRSFLLLLALIAILLSFIPQQPISYARPAQAPSAPATAAAISDGLAWLDGQQSSAGAWLASARGLSIRDTATVAQALASARPAADPTLQQALRWLSAQSSWETDLQARSAVALQAGGWRGPAQRTPLADLQHDNGSWGDDAFGWQGNAFDTALALQALAGLPTPPQQQAQAAFAYLQSERQADGSWRLVSDRSSVRATATVLIGIGAFRQHYNVDGLVAPAIAYLHTKQHGDGSFGDNPSGTVAETALALLGLWAAGDADQAVLDQARTYLLAQQAGNGAWNNRAYDTALAILALNQRAVTRWTGQIIDSFNQLNRPVANATITIDLPGGPLQATSAADGSFVLENIPPGVHDAVLSKSGYTSTTITAPAVAGRSIDLGQLPITLINTQVDFTWSPDPIQQGQSVSFTSNIAPAAGQSIVSYKWRTSADQNATGTTPTWSFTFNGAGTFTVTLTVIDSAGATLERTKSLAVNPPPPVSADPNQRPLITLYPPTGSCTAEAGMVGSCSFSAFVTLRDGSSDYGILWDFGDGTIEDGFYRNHSYPQHLYADDGVFNVTANVLTTNGMTASATMPFTVTNVAPSVDAGPDRTVTTGAVVALPVSVSDPSSADAGVLVPSWDFGDGSTATPSVVNRAGSTVTAVVTHTWTTPGTYQVAVTADDFDGGITTDQATYTVQNANHKPVVSSQAPDLAVVGVPYSYQVSASDPDGDALTYTLLQAPLGMTISAAGLIRWTPLITQTGFVPVQLKLSDGNGGMTLHWWGITVLPSAPTSDLIVHSVDTSAMAADPQSLQASGTVAASIQNIGLLSTTLPFSVTFFDDTNLDRTWSPGVDSVLGIGTVSQPLAAQGSTTVSAAVAGTVLFRDNVVYAYVDSGQRIDEVGREDNNIGQSASTSADQYVPPVGVFAPTIKWSWKGFINDDRTFALNLPAVSPLVDTNADGVVSSRDVPALVFVFNQYRNSVNAHTLIALRGDTGQQLCQTQFNTNVSGVQMHPTIGDLNHDGRPEIVLYFDIYNPVYQKQVAVFDAGCRELWRTSVDTPCLSFTEYNSGLTLADLDGDRDVEIIVGMTALNNDGSIRWNRSESYSSCFPTVADINADGRPEIVYGDKILNADGALLRSFAEQINGSVAIGNFDADPEPELLSLGLNQTTLVDEMRLRNADGSTIWGPIAISDGYANAPTLGDFNLDGVPDIAHNMEPSSTLMVRDGRNGNVLWSRYFANATASSNGVSAFDFDGDGALELAYNEENGVYLFDGLTGNTLWQSAYSSATAFEYPVIADLDADGHADFVILTDSAYSSSDYGTATVYSDRFNTWRPARPTWNQYDYVPTQINTDSSVPQFPAPSWLKYNTFRVQAPPDTTDPFATPDLTASLLLVDAAQCGAAVDLTLRVGNGGGVAAPAGISVAFYHDSLDPANLLGATTTARTLAPGDFEDVRWTWLLPPTSAQTLIAVVNGQAVTTNVPEGDHANNVHSRTLTLCDAANHAPVFTTTSLPVATVDQPYAAPIQATDSDGDALVYALVDGPAQLALHPTAGAAQWVPAAADLGDHALTVTVADGRGGSATTTLTLTVALPAAGGDPPPVCTTPGGDPADPEIPGNGQDDDCNPSTPDVIPAGSVVATIATDRRVYPSNTTGLLLATVRNTHPSFTLVGLQAHLRAAAGSAADVTLDLPPLAPGTSLDVSQAFDTATVPPGAYVAQIDVRAASASAASASSDFSIIAGADVGVALKGALSLTTTSITVTIGAPISTTWQVQNIGNTDLSQVLVQVLAVDPVTGAVRGRTAQLVDLAQQQSAQGSALIPHVIHSGPLLLVLTATVATVEQSLDSQGVVIDGAVRSNFLPLVMR